MTDRSRRLRALLRQDLSAFGEKVFNTLEPGTTYTHNWHLDHIAWQLTRVLRGDIKRLIINVPPRSGKSILVSVAFTAWVLGHDPTKRIISVSYAEDLARKLSLDTRRIMESAWYKALFPLAELIPRLQRNVELKTKQQGIRFAAGVGGSVLGRGADLIVVDDPIKALDAFSAAERRRVADFFDNTLATRLNDKQNGAIVIVMQRLHEDDLVGHVLNREDWEVVSLPAIASEEMTYPLSDRPSHVHTQRSGEPLQALREPINVLEGLRRQLGTLTFQAQYQQEPVPAQGHVIRLEWLRYYADNECPAEFDRVVVSWDTASTLGEHSDYSVGTVWGAVGLDFYLLDVVRDRLEVPELRREIVRLSEHWQADATIIEATELGRAIAADFRRAASIRPILQIARFSKEARLLAQSTRFETGQVHLPSDAPFLGDFIGELLAFPLGRHDDQVDSTSQALIWLNARTPVDRPLIRRNPVRRNITRR